MATVFILNGFAVGTWFARMPATRDALGLDPGGLLTASLGFPVGMSAAADGPGRAVARVSVVAVIGYTAILAGPTPVGLLGDRVGNPARCSSCPG